MANTGRSRQVRLCAFAAYLVMLHAVVLVLVFKTDFLLVAGKTLGLVPPEEWTPDLVSRILEQAARDGSVAPGGVALIGDSTIARLDARALGADAVNFGIGGDTIRTLLSRLPTIRSVQTSRAVVMEVGVNDLKYRKVDQIALDYDALLRRLPSATPILAVSVLPARAGGPAARHRSYLRNDSIAAINREIRTLCQARAQCRFLDVWPAMAGGDVYAEDGWHLSPTGNQILAAAIREALPAPE